MMVLLSCAVLCLAIAALQTNRRAVDEVTRLLLNVTVFLCALFCILVAPWFIQLLMLLSLLVLPTCLLKRQAIHLPCPHLCIGRWRCPAPKLHRPPFADPADSEETPTP